jgi:hypothetical protein
MGFRVPTFNLRCNISAAPFAGGPYIPDPPYRLTDQVCQLTYGTRVNVASTGGTTDRGVIVQTMNLLLPARTDVRGPQNGPILDMVEVPAGSGRWYSVVFVDDIGRGFTNEHRTAAIYAVPGAWPTPCP